MTQQTQGAVKTVSPRIFFIIWFLINLIQASATGLMDDEAYYWVYSRFLDWGYFDHPPMTALMIKAGTLLFPGELGVRFFIVLTNTLTLWIIYKLLQKRNDGLFYLIAAGMAVLQIGGILAVPDLPLVFFIACFFYVYQQFLRNDSLKNTVLLGLTMSLMLYAKYHGVLVVLFTLASNPSLIKKWQSWLAVMIGAVLFVPHLVWQYNHGFPSVQYHLFERNAPAYKAGFTFEYLGGQLALMGPIIGWLLLWASWKYKPTNRFEWALRWNLFGILVFFGISTFKGRVEANWTIPVFVPLIILSHQYLTEKTKWWPFLRVSAIITLVLVLVVRVYMIADIEPLKWVKKDEVHKNHEWGRVIKERAAGRPVVFIDSYQEASKYWFYTGDTALSVNTVNYRRNNYNFWPIEKQFCGRPVLWATRHRDYQKQFPDSLATPRGLYPVYDDPCFYSRMGDWLDVDVKASPDGDFLVQQARFSSDDAEGSCMPDSSRMQAFLSDGKRRTVFLQTDFAAGFGLRDFPLTIHTDLDTNFFPGLQVRYGIPASAPGIVTLSSRTVKVEPKKTTE